MTAIYFWKIGDLCQSNSSDCKNTDTFKILNWLYPAKLSQIIFGKYQSALLADDGQVYTCDNETFGATPQCLEELKDYVVCKLAGGLTHFHALSEWGQLFSWGQNDCGQLGIPDIPSYLTYPKIVKHLGTKVIVQIASGENHCIALSNCGEVYVWGSNNYGQLGIGSTSDVKFSATPRLLTSLSGIPISHIACGGSHSFVISKSGAIFGWGKNNCGQLGLNDEQNRCFPTQLKTLRNLGVRYIACGDDFSVFLTHDGGVFTSGAGARGQLGHGSKSNEHLPRKVLELMGSTITQIACGSQHTVAFDPTRNRVYIFGVPKMLGDGPDYFTVPQAVNGPWVSENMENNKKKSIYIAAGGNFSMTIAAEKSKHPSLDNRIYDPKTQILNLSVELAKKCSEISKSSLVDMDLLNTIETIFTSQSCLNGSFLIAENNSSCSSKNSGVDFREAQKAFKYIQTIENETLKTLICDKVMNDLLPSLSKSPPDVEALRIYLILPIFHEFVNVKHYEKLHSPFSGCVMSLTEIPKKIVSKWWSLVHVDWFDSIVCNYKNVITYIISFKFIPNTNNASEKRLLSHNVHLVAVLDLLGMLHSINHLERQVPIPYQIFHWPELTDYVDLQQSYLHWLFDNNADSFNICNYSYLFNASAKTTLLQMDQAIQMHSAMYNAANNSFNFGFLSMFAGVPTVGQYLVLNVSRQNLVDDTLREILQHNENDLKKPLKIKFHGEEAEDAGGVRKEFFMLLLKDLLDPKYGMFKEFEESRSLWFADVTFETEDMYMLIGVICGLAIYNFTIINLPFPLALYKKLLNEPVNFNDLNDLSPTIFKSMKQLLEYDDESFESLDMRFEVTRDFFGDHTTVPLKPNGSEIKVTAENKQEFVDLYIDYVFNKAVASQFLAFQKGFLKVCWGRVLKMFKPEELMAVVVGNENYDWLALETNCEYKEGYNSGDPTVKWFWEVFHDLPESDKKKFLLFLTGSDRIPIQGMKEIKISIQPTKDDRYLPVAHTCFNLLDLPRYKTKERLKCKLKQAIQQTQGFSLV